MFEITNQTMFKDLILKKICRSNQAASGKNNMKPTNPNAHTYVNGTDVNTHGYAVTHNTFLQ